MLQELRAVVRAGYYRWSGARGAVAGLLRLTESLAYEPDATARLQSLCSVAAGLMRCQRVSLFLADGDRFRAAFNHGNPPDIAAVFPRHRVSARDPLITEAVRRRSAVLVNDAARSPLMDARTARRARINAIVVAPVLDASGRALGFVTAEYNERRGRFSVLHGDLLDGVARLVALALDWNGARAEPAGAEPEGPSAGSGPTTTDEEREARRVELIDHSVGELGNHLTVLTIEAELMESAEQGATTDSAARIAHASWCAGRLVRRVQRLRRRRARVGVRTDVARRIRGVVDRFARAAPEGLRIETRFGACSGEIVVDRSVLDDAVATVLESLATEAGDDARMLLSAQERAPGEIELRCEVTWPESVEPEPAAVSPRWRSLAPLLAACGFDDVRMASGHGARVLTVSLRGGSDAGVLDRPDPERAGTSVGAGALLWLVEPDVRLAGPLAEGLERHGHPVRVFHDVRAAMDAFIAPDCRIPGGLVVDFEPGDSSMRAFVQMVQVWSPAIAVVALSALANGKGATRSLPGALTLRKPVTASEIARRLTAIMPASRPARA